MLTIVSRVNLSLCGIEGRAPAPAGAYRFPRALPLLAFLSSTVLRELLTVAG